LQAPVLSLPLFAARWIIRHDSYSARFYKAGYSCMVFLASFSSAKRYQTAYQDYFKIILDGLSVLDGSN
jgi:hypothetical protein